MDARRGSLAGFPSLGTAASTPSDKKMANKAKRQQKAKFRKKKKKGIPLDQYVAEHPEVLAPAPAAKVEVPKETAPEVEKEEKKETVPEAAKEETKKEPEAAPKKASQKKEKKTSQKKEKKAKQSKADKKAAKQEKKVKAAIKEGGKKGQDIVGLSEMGGVKFFHVSLDTCGDSFELLDHALAGFNKEVDESADDRKGGAGNLGKFLFSYGEKKLIFLCHAPEAVKSLVDINEWFDIILKTTGGTEVASGSDTIKKGEMLADPDAGRFPIKVRDDAIQRGYVWLQDKQLVLVDESDDDFVYGDDDFPDYYAEEAAPAAAAPAPADTPKVGGKGGLPPAWLSGGIEAPAGERDMGGFTRAVYTDEQQARLNVDENGAERAAVETVCDWIVPPALIKKKAFPWPERDQSMSKSSELETLRKLHKLENACNDSMKKTNPEAAQSTPSKKHKREASVDVGNHKKTRTHGGAKGPWEVLEDSQNRVLSRLDDLEQRMWQHLSHRQERVLTNLSALEKLQDSLANFHVDDVEELLRDDAVDSSKKRKPSSGFYPFEETFALEAGSKRTRSQTPDSKQTPKKASRVARNPPANPRTLGPEEGEDEHAVMKRQMALSSKLGLKSSGFSLAPSDYYDWELEQRRDLLRAPSTDRLCKSIVMENTKCRHKTFADSADSRYYVVCVQYIARLHNEKLCKAVRAHIVNTKGKEACPGKKHFNMRLVSTEVNSELTGFSHNGVSPLGCKNKIPMIVSDKIMPFKGTKDDYIWLGGGHVNLKWRISIDELLEHYEPIVADITY